MYSFKQKIKEFGAYPIACEPRPGLGPKNLKALKTFHEYYNITFTRKILSIILKRPLV